MEYSDGTDTEVGEQLVDGSQSLGSATYDSDHDGVADSVIVGQDDHSVMLTDTDGDGNIDAKTEFDSAGNVVSSEIPGYESADGPSTQTVSTTTGDGGTDTGGTDSGDGVSPAPDGTSQSGASGSGVGGSETGSGTGADPESGESTQAGSAVSTIVVVNPDGSSTEVGEPTVDLNGDGAPDTASVTNADGSVTGYTDRDGDGVADQAAVIATDGTMKIYVADGTGGWNQVASGHLDSDGTFVEDKESSFSGESSSTEAVSPDGGNAESSAASLTDSAAAEPATSGGITYTDAQGNVFALGEPTTDLDGDSVPETVVSTLDDGTTVCYSDADGDGQIDQVIQIDPDGAVTIGVPDGNGGWEAAATGTIGANGEFVASA